MLNMTDLCFISSAASNGAFLLSGALNVFSQDMKARQEASLLTATRNTCRKHFSRKQRYPSKQSSPKARLRHHECN